MPSLLKRRNKGENGSAAEQPAPEATAVVDTSQDEPRPPTGMVVPAEPAQPAEPPATYEMPGTGVVDMDRPPSFEPAPPPPDPPRGSGTLLERAFGDPGEIPQSEKDRIAQAEFEQAIAPVLEMMRAAVPGASTPEEAARILSENQGEVTPDPQGGAYVPGDAFDADARVYYRLLRRDYEKNPRPSEKKKVSPHLHGAYGKLPGTRGW
ncbi:MAG TPA: hypothetical protein VHF27_04600 [Acidimicrobiales bacterium]|nr:hypothetical protein [Acidimicrobiales bacterium]